MNMAKEPLEQYKELSEKTSVALDGLKNAIERINDTNVLHMQMLKENTQAVNNITTFWGKIVMILISTVAILAGAEKVLSLFR